MKYLELDEISFSKEELEKSHNVLGDRNLWVGREPGAYLTGDGVTTVMALWNGEFASIFPAPSTLLRDTKPQMGEDTILNHLAVIHHQLKELHGKSSQPASQGIDGNTLAKALAICQKPELAKELCRDS